LFLLWPTSARAIEYEVFVDVDDEEDIYDLQATGQIDDSTFEVLLDLIRRGVDLDTADRAGLYDLPNLSYEEVDKIIAYRSEAGGIRDPADLVVAGVLSQRKLASIAAFIVVPRDAPKAAVDGFVRYRNMWLVGDARVPPMLLQARLSTLRYLTIGGAAVLQRTRPENVAWDPNRQALIADPPGPRVRVPKYFVQWDTPKWGVIAGTYRIGFGERLVFDNSGRYAPNNFYLDDAVLRRQNSTRSCRESAGELDASPCSGEAAGERMTPDFYVREPLRGLALGARKLEVDQGWFQAFGFGSVSRRPIYQYQIYDKAVCDDPNDESPECSAPDVFHRRDPRLDPTTRFSYLTLPNMYDEYTGGGNVTYFYNRRTRFGITGYGTAVEWVPEGPDLDFQEWARQPTGGRWGAVGPNFSWGRKWADVFAEAARSFDSSPTSGNGGYAALVRNTATWDEHEVEVSVRYYDAKYANPNSRAISAPDFTNGLRAQDEAGFRVRYNTYLFDRWSLRAFADTWLRVSETRPLLRVFARSDVTVNKWWRPGLWLEYQTRDLRRDPGACLLDIDEETLPPQCAGQRVRIIGRSRFDPHKRVNITLQYGHDFQDDSYEAGGDLGSFDTDSTGNVGGDLSVQDLADYDLRDRIRQDISAYVTLSTTPIDPLRIRTRWRWWWEDITDNSRFEHSIWGYIDASYKIRPWAIPALRYDIIVFVDDRGSTQDRAQNPEHWLSFQWTSRF
jgi:hypothetical protein